MRTTESPVSTAVEADWLECPECHRSLRQHGEKLQCSGCEKSWPVVDGIPHFVQDFPYWGEIPQEQMQEVNRQAQAGPWKAALLDSHEPSVQSATPMILNLDRANWHWLVDLPGDSRVLELGAGTGTNSHALATRFREVVAVEPVEERVQFMQQRFTQEKLDNVRILRSSLWTLPFPKESFDLVAMNGVLEWVATGRPGDPGEVQEAALRNACRLLRPGGYLYVGIENRLRFGSFIGYPDPHCGLPFVTILPRPLAHWYARRKGQSGYRNYLYSSHGYRKLLKRTGFRSIEVYLALPSYNHPRFLIPMDSRIFSYYSRTFNPDRRGRLRNLAHGILLKLGILAHFEYSFAILARK